MNTLTFTAPRADVYTRVTSKVIADLEKGVRTWLKPWTVDSTETRAALPLRHNGVPYRGINILLLWCEAIEKGYKSSKWMTYKQAFELGAHVRKGEHGTMIVYTDMLTKMEENDKGEEVQRNVSFMKGYTVFNVAQIEGLPEEYLDEPLIGRDKMQLIDEAEQFFATTGAVVHHGGATAYYARGADVIQLPEPEAFRDAESYTATKAHELTHWTSHPTRMAREFGAKRFGDEGYAMEELVAELGAAFLCAVLGISPEARDDHAAYIGHWLKVLQSDKRAIFTAAAHAQRAVDYLQGLLECRSAAA